MVPERGISMEKMAKLQVITYNQNNCLQNLEELKVISRKSGDMYLNQNTVKTLKKGGFFWKI